MKIHRKTKSFISHIIRTYFPALYWLLLFNIIKKRGKYEIATKGNTIEIRDKDRTIIIKNGKNRKHDVCNCSFQKIKR